VFKRTIRPVSFAPAWRAGAAPAAGQREMRAVGVGFFRDSERFRRTVHCTGQRSQLGPGLDADPENTGHFEGGKESVSVQPHFDANALERRKRLFGLLHVFLRFFSNELQRNVERLRPYPTRVRGKSPYPFHELSDPLADGLVNVESEENPHGFEPSTVTSA